MGLLDFMTDPFGRRYKKRSMNERLGITNVKRKLNKKFIQPFNKLNPMWHLRNAKRNIKYKLGYNSEIARAYRSGDWGRYVKRKIMDSESPGMIMPFRESQFTPYDMQSNPFDRDQTGPTHKGVFHKLAKYAAPGAVVGLAVLASKKHNLLGKLMAKMKKHDISPTRMQAALAKMKAGGKELFGKAYAKGKETLTGWRDTLKVGGGTVAHEVKTWGGKKLDKYRAKVAKILKPTTDKLGKVMPSAKKFAKERKATGKTKTKRDKQSADCMVMPFMESQYGMHYQQPQRPKISLAHKIITAGAVAGGVYAGIKGIGFLSDANRLAAGAERAHMRVKSLIKLQKKSTSSIHPMVDAKLAWARMKHDMYSGAIGVTTPFRSVDAIKDANHAAMMVRVRKTYKALKKKYPKTLATRRKIVHKSVMAGDQYHITRKKVANKYFDAHPRKVKKPKDLGKRGPTITNVDTTIHHVGTPGFARGNDE